MNYTTVAATVLKEVTKVSFSWYDYILFSLMLIFSMIIGIYFGCFGSKQATADEYLMGGKKMKVIPIGMSLVASHISGLALLAVPADIYTFGAAYALLIISVILASISTAYVFLPVFFHLGITSTYEYLERRFDSKCRKLASALFALVIFLYLPIVIYIPALAFSTATGLKVSLVAPIVCAVCIFYTTLGGLKAVVWTDTMQFTITLSALATVFGLGIYSAGGFGNVVQKAYESNRFHITFNLDLTDRDNFWVVTLGLFGLWTSMLVTNQSCVQKFLSVSTYKESKQSVWFFGFGMSFVLLVTSFTGLVMYAIYYNCDPFSTGAVHKKDELLPYYVMDVAGHVPGLPGLFIAGVFCAGLSTLSAHLNCLAGTIYEDFLVAFLNKPSERKAAVIIKTTVVIVGIICTGLVFVVEQFDSILTLALSLGSVSHGPMLGIFALGMLFPKANKHGALWGTIIGFIVISWITFTAQYYGARRILVQVPKPTSTAGCLNVTTASSFWNYTTPASVFEASLPTSIPEEVEEGFVPLFIFRISFYLFTIISALLTFISGACISLLTNKKDDPQVDRDLISPVLHFLLSEEKEEEYKYKSVDTALRIVKVHTDN